jgi:hypothetical protein
MTNSTRRASLASLLIAGTLGIAACGGSDDGGTTTGDAAKPAETGAATPEAAIQQYFTAKRLGKAADGCALETEKYQTAQYGSAGQACLDDQANKSPQAVWADTTKIVSIDKSGESATATIQPNAGTPAEARITLVRTGGGWLVDSLQ